jgi:Uma2 family endonuclease
MAPSPFHEISKTLIGRMIELLSLEWDIPIRSLGSATFHPPGAPHGLEGDEIYFVAHEPQMRLRTDYDPDRDPPPDLAVEVDVTSSPRARLAVYASWGVPEVWRHDGQRLTFLQLTERGEYEPAPRSVAFPRVEADDIQHFLDLLPERGEHQMMREFAHWARRKQDS